MEDTLSIVNHMLTAIGERKVVSLETGHPSVAQARDALTGWNKDFQTRGWWFNTNNAVTLVTDNRGEVLLPDSILSFKVADAWLQYASPEDKKRYVQRGKRVYDTVKNTFTIQQSIKADIVVLLPVEELPHPAAAYLKHMAAEQFVTDDDGDQIKVNKLNERTVAAWHRLMAEELKNQSTNALDSPAASLLRYRIRQTSGPSNPMLPGGRFQ